MPLNWSEPSGSQINLFVARRLVDEPAGDLWLLDGGPGSSGQKLFQDAAAMTELGQHNLYLLSHRGSGKSTPLCCEGAKNGSWSTWDIEDCGRELFERWGEGLIHFGVEQAAFDLRHLIERWTQPGQEVVLYAHSYGTYWAQHLLQHQPTELRAVIFDGILDIGADVWRNAILADQIGRRVFTELCPKSPACRAALGYDAVERVKEVFARFETQDSICPAFAGISRREFAGMLGGFTFRAGTDPALAPLAAGLVARLSRCDATDQQQLTHFLRGWRQRSELSSPATCTGSFTPGAYLNGLGRDLLAPLSTWPTRELEIADEELWLFARAELPILRRVYESWPTLPTSGERVPFNPVDRQLPMLMLHGGLDHQTVEPWAERVFGRFDGPKQHAVVIDVGGHGLVFGDHASETARRCTHRLFSNFLANPDAELDTTCASETGLPDFEAENEQTRRASLRVFGSEHLYNEGPTDATNSLGVHDFESSHAPIAGRRFLRFFGQ